MQQHMSGTFPSLLVPPLVSLFFSGGWRQFIYVVGRLVVAHTRALARAPGTGKCMMLL